MRLLACKEVIILVLLFVAGVCEATYVEVFAGSFATGYYGDGGPAFKPFCSFNKPAGIALDSHRNMYIADNANSVVRKIDYKTKTITTIAGTPTVPGFSADGTIASKALLNYPIGVFVDLLDNIYIADTGNNLIRKIDPITNTISTVAGNGNVGYSGDGAIATSAMLSYPRNVHVDSYQNIYITDTSNSVIRKVNNLTKIITTIAGNGNAGYSGDGAIATSAMLNNPTSVHVDSYNNIYIVDSGNHVIRKVNNITKVITNVVGSPENSGFSGDSGPATGSQINSPKDVCFDSTGNMFITDHDSHIIRRVDATTKIITTVAGVPFQGGYSDSTDVATSSKLKSPYGCVFDVDGTLYFTELDNFVVRKFNLTSNIISTAYGVGTTFGQPGSFYGDGIVAGGSLLPKLSLPKSVLVDKDGRIIIFDSGNNVVRSVNPKTGIITTIMGGNSGFSGDGSIASNAEFNYPSSAAFDIFGNLYIADTYNAVIRKVDNITQIITTVAGVPQSQGSDGDGGPATSALFMSPVDIAVAANGDLYICDSNNQIIKKVDFFWQNISTVAGILQTPDVPTDGVVATSSSLNNPDGICLDSQGNLYVADTNNNAIRRVDAKTNIITTVVVCNFPSRCYIDKFDNIFFSEKTSSQVKLFVNSTRTVITLAGTDAYLSGPSGLTMDRHGSILVADGSTIRKISFNCSGVLSNNEKVCSGFGSCSYNGVCNCLEGYNTTEICEPICFSLLAHVPEVCSGNGLCIDNDVCSCNSDYGGSKCDVPKCFGIMANDPDSCSGYTCSGVNTCDCPSNRFGEDCSQYIEYANYTSTTIGVRSPDRSNIQVCNAVNCEISATDFTTYGSDMYVTDLSTFKIWRVRDGMAYKYLGNGVVPTSFNPNIDTMSVQSDSIAFSNSGEFYFTHLVNANNQNYYYVLKIDNQRTLQVLLGTGNQECTDNMLGTQCAISRASYLTFDSSDALYFAAASGNCVKMMDTVSRKVYHVAGDCLNSGSAVGSFASTKFNGINDLKYKDGILYVLERPGRVIKALNLTSKTSSIVVSSQSLTSPLRMSLDSNGGMYICDFDASVIKYYNGSIVVNYAGTGSGLMTDNPVDGTDLLSAIMKPTNVKVFNDVVYIATGGGYLKKVVNGKLYAAVGSPEWNNDGNLIKYASVSSPKQVTATRKSIMYFDNNVMKMDKSSTILKNLLSGVSLEKFEANSKEEFYATASSTSISHYSATGQLISRNGKDSSTFSGDGLIATSAYVKNPKDLFFRNGSIYYLDIGYHTVRKLNMANSIINLGISTTSSYMYASDNYIIISTTNNTFVKYDMSFVKQAEVSFSDIPQIYDMYYNEGSNKYVILNGTSCTVVDQFGNLFYTKADSTCTLMKPNMVNGSMKWYFYDQLNSTILKVDAVYASIDYISDSLFANLTQFLVFNESLIYFTKSNDAAIYQLDMNTNTISLFLGNSSFAGYMDDTFENSLFTNPTYLTKISNQQFVVADSIRLRLVDLSTRTVSTIAGGVGDGEGNFATASFSNSLMKTNYKDELLIIDSAHKSIRKVSGNSISTIVGKYKTNKADAMSNALTLSLTDPSGVCEDEDGNVYVSDRQEHVVRKISVNGTVSIIAGKLGVSGYSGDNGDASQSLLKMPSHLRCSKGSPAQIFIIDSGNTALRKILTNNKIITISNEYATVFDLYESDGSKIVTLDVVGETIKILNGVCLNGYSGDRCDIWSCNGIPYNENSTCNKHGNCTNLNTCQCKDGWTGNNCEHVTCFGITGSDPKVCSSGNGTCIGFDTCECVSGRTGADCSISSCFGIPENSSYVCSGHGVCSASVCTCNNEWTGSNCSIPLCFGLSGRAGCNQHGSCVMNNTCQCDSKWFGTNCSTHSCNGTAANDGGTCNGYGNCYEMDKCKCSSSDWSGQFCEQPNCFGLNSSDPSVCSSNGQCVGLNTCQCNSKWYGTNCSIHSCNGTRADNYLNVCNGHGQCVSLDTCKCSSDWSGQFCEQPNCFGLNSSDPSVCSGNGDCVGLNVCQCDSYWYGSNCSVHSCNGTRSDIVNTCNGHGSCHEMDKCQCSSDWSGQFCEKPNCFGLNSSDPSVCSGHGQCIGLNTCQCNSKRFGTNCSIHSCNGTRADIIDTCNGQGSCYEMDKCQCSSDWSGQFCEQPNCFGLNASDPNVCSGNGQCIGLNTCQCNSKWFGSNCSIHSCNGTRADDLNTCNGKGQCVSLDVCTCNSADWSGQFCEKPNCFGLISSDPTVCSGHGQCIGLNTCQCNSKWFGSNCSTHSCGGISASDSLTCSSHGACLSMDNCNCFNGYNGSNCERHTCYGKANDDSSVCSSKGVCSGSDTCSCFETLIGKTVGQECSSIKCIGPNNQWIDSTDSNVCSKRGACQFNNSTSIGCQCSEGFTGEYCQWNLCYGISENSNQVCSGHGSCSTPNQCTCHDDDVNGHFTGSQCEKCKVPYSGINCNTIENCNAAEKCNSHGTCDDFGFCTCYQNVTNGYWNGTNCQNCKVDYYGEDCLTQFLSTIKFNNQGSALLFKMSYPYHFEALSIDCKDLLETEKMSSFGSNPICRYSNKTTNEFIIELDQDHSINVNDQIKLNRNVFNRISKVNDNASFNIETASQPSNPIISISQKNSYSSCENVQLDASESYSLDRKQLSFKWEIVNSNLNSLSHDNSSKLSINYQDLNAGSHTFKLSVTSYILKTTSSKQVTFQKLAYSTPIISIDGDSKVSIKTSELPLIIRKKIALPECLAPNSEVIVEWEYSGGSGAQYQVDSFNNLKISKFNDLTQTSHQFTVSTYVKGNALQKSTAIVNIELSISPLTVNLLMVESTVNYVTFEVEEIDLDGEDAQFTRSWSFNNLANSNTIMNYLQSNTNNSMTITKQMTEGSSKFDITLQSSKGSRSATSTISLNFPISVIQIPPIVTLANSVPSKVNKGDLLNIQLLVSGEGNLIREWNLNSKSIPQSMIDSMRVSLSDSNSLLMNTGSLDFSSLNKVKFNVTNSNSGLSATFEHSFTINKNPSACNCQILPSTGVAMTTLYTFNCPSCQNEEKSYKFEYGFIDDFSGSYITLSKDDELYQKLPAPYYGNELALYVKVTDSLTGASTLTTRKVTVSLPSVKSVAEIQKLAKSWNSVASLLAVGDYRRSVFNSATISRTTTMMLKALSGKRSVCNGNGQLGSDGKCICNQGFVSSDCKWTSEQFETNQILFKDLLNDLINSNQVKLESGEITNREFLTNMLFGIDSILQNYEFFNSQLFNSSLTVLKQSVDSIDSTSYLTFTSGEIVYLKSILNSLYKFVTQSSNEKNTDLINQSRKLGRLILRSVFIGQSPIKFETMYHLNLLNKHFKNELNLMMLQSENTNITLPSTISQSISTKSIKTPITYDWYILKDGSSSFILPQKSGNSVSLVSAVNELTLTPSPSLIQDSKIVYSVKLNRFKGEASYMCVHMSNYEAITSNDCSIKIENQIAKCECSQIYNIAILEYLPNTVTPETPKSGGISDLYWILWAFLIALCVLINIALIVGVIIYKLKKKPKQSNSYESAQHNAVSIEMKQV